MWEETVKEKTWLLDKKWRITKAKRFRQAAFVPEKVKSLGIDIFHCYDHTGTYSYQCADLDQAKKYIETLAKTYADSKS